MNPPSRYAPALSMLHWLVAALIFLNIGIAVLVLEEMPNTAEKLDPLRAHMTIGLVVGVLVVLRLIVRIATKAPPSPHASRGLTLLARANHWLFYAVILALVSTGLGTAQFAGLFPLLQGAPVTLPADIKALQPFRGHELFGTALLALLALHVAGVLFHLFGRHPHILGRIGIGRAVPAESERAP